MKYSENSCMFAVSDGYAWQKVSEAAICLVAARSLSNALVGAAHALIGFPVEDVPDEIKGQYLSLMTAFTCVRSTDGEGAIAASLRVMPPSRQARLAELVLKLYGSVSKWCGVQESSGLDLTNSGKKFVLNDSEKYAFLDWDEFQAEREGAVDLYYELVEAHLPNFPREVIRHWLLRHSPQVRREWAHLSWPKWKFEKVQWSFEQLTKIQARDPGWTEVGPNSQGGSHVNSKNENWLASYMKESLTWPVAPIVLEHSGLSDASSQPLPAPLVLVEGHRRLSYLLNLGEGARKRKHDVWLVHIEGSRSTPASANEKEADGHE